MAYTGTHDNETLAGWFGSISKEEMAMARDYLCDQYTPRKYLYKPFIGLIMRSRAKLCIIPMQDYLGYDNSGSEDLDGSGGKSRKKWKNKVNKEQKGGVRCKLNAAFY